MLSGSSRAGPRIFQHDKFWIRSEPWSPLVQSAGLTLEGSSSLRRRENDALET